jgi:pyruvate dehydrogenase E1 component
VSSEVWSVTSFNELRRDGLDVDRWNMLHPDEAPKKSFVTECLEGSNAPVIAATDYMKVYADQIRPFVPASYRVLGTDGFGRSDTRQQLRWFFEVDRHFVAVAALASLADQQIIARSVVRDAMRKFGIEPEKPNPRLV